MCLPHSKTVLSQILNIRYAFKSIHFLMRNITSEKWSHYKCNTKHYKCNTKHIKKSAAKKLLFSNSHNSLIRWLIRFIGELIQIQLYHPLAFRKRGESLGRIFLKYYQYPIPSHLKNISLFIRRENMNVLDKWNDEWWCLWHPHRRK